MAQVGQKSETWKQKRANMRASVSMRVRVRVRDSATQQQRGCKERTWVRWAVSKVSK